MKKIISVTVIREEKPCITQLRKKWRRALGRINKDTAICCETCRFVGEARWHCHSLSSLRNGINVMPWNYCSHWMPNMGLMMYLTRRKISLGGGETESDLAKQGLA